MLGLVAAWYLRKDGHEVTIVDRAGVFAGASHRSFAWINANHKQPRPYHRLNAAGIAAHRTLQDEIAAHGTWFHQCGCIMTDSSPQRAKFYEERAQESEHLGYPVERIDGCRLAELEPSVDWSTDSALFFPDEGHLDNDLFGRVIRSLLAEVGAEPQLGEVLRIDSDSSGAAVEFAGSVTENYDQVVIAAGADSGALTQRSGLTLPVAPLDVPGPRTHSLLGVTALTEVDLNRVIISDRINAASPRTA